MNFKKTWVLFICLLLVQSFSFARFFGINVFRPWDVNLRPDVWPGEPIQLTGYYEGGVKATGRNPENESVNVMQIWTPTQDGLAMLKGFGPQSPETEYLIDTGLIGVDDNGIRGNFDVTGDFHLNASAGMAFRYHLCYDVVIGAYLPIYAMKLNNIKFRDLTPETNGQNELVRENLTDNFFEVVKMFDPDLNFRGWNRAGVGDFGFTAEWFKYFPQQKPYLKNVGVNARIGFTIPTGVRENINDILSIPFGFDGSFGLFGNMAIYLNWFNHIRGGIDFQFLHLFGNTKEQRIKVQDDQTDFLFLAKARAFIDYGFTQRYHLFLEAYRVVRGLSFGFAYEFWKHSEDTLTLCSEEFSNIIANTAENLQEWTFHQLIFDVRYDFLCDVNEDSAFKPQLYFFYKFPFNGKRSILVNTVGAAITFNF